MTSVSGGGQPRDHPDERRRRTTEAALLAFRPVMRQESGRPIGWETPSRARALEELAGTNLHRVLKHRLLIRALGRSRRDDQEALDQPIRRVLDSTLGGDLGQGQRRSRVDEAKRHLDAVAGTSGGRRPLGTHWEQWVARTDHIFRFSTPEATFRACDDSVVTVKANPHGQLVPSRLITAEFWSDQPPADFTTYVDPFNWPRCSPFWKAMRELGPRTATATGYDCEVEETVCILGETLVVPLQVAHRVRLDRSRVWTRFNIARNHYTPSTPVDVDTGTVSAESITGGPARTLVRATKYLHWRDPDRLDLTMLACASGWSELIVEMVEACRVAGPSEQERR